jgi:hypothetical protein
MKRGWWVGVVVSGLAQSLCDTPRETPKALGLQDILTSCTLQRSNSYTQQATRARNNQSHARVDRVTIPGASEFMDEEHRSLRFRSSLRCTQALLLNVQCEAR